MSGLRLMLLRTLAVIATTIPLLAVATLVAPGATSTTCVALTGLELAHRVVHESLRLHPAGLIGARVAATDLRIGAHLIRKGTLVVWSPHLAGRDPGSWSDRCVSTRTVFST